MGIVSGGGGGFNGGTVTGATTFTAPVTIAPTSNAARPLTLALPVGAILNGDDALRVTTADKTNPLLVEIGVDGSIVMFTNDALSGTIKAANDDHVSYSAQARYDGRLLTSSGFYSSIIASGALPTVAPVSGTAFQPTAQRDVFLAIPFTGDATNNAATLKVELSPDNVTFSTLDTLSIAAALNLTGAINVPVTVAVPAAWYVKLTATHGAIGTATYY